MVCAHDVVGLHAPEIQEVFCLARSTSVRIDASGRFWCSAGPLLGAVPE